jgi:RNA polymerase sigma-70 factor (ECF subfamily)
MIAGGDRQAMHLLFSRHNARVYRFVLRIIGNASSAEDIVSDTFLDVWRRAGGFGSRSQASTWLLAIARNKAASALRRPADEQLDGDTLAVAEPADNPEASLDKKHRSAAIRACLLQLSSAHREVLDLVYYHEKTIAEVAQIIGSPAGTVKTRMHYARQRMRELLNAAGLDAV